MVRALTGVIVTFEPPFSIVRTEEDLDCGGRRRRRIAVKSVDGFGLGPLG